MVLSVEVFAKFPCPYPSDTLFLHRILQLAVLEAIDSFLSQSQLPRDDFGNHVRDERNSVVRDNSCDEQQECTLVSGSEVDSKSRDLRRHQGNLHDRDSHRTCSKYVSADSTCRGAQRLSEPVHEGILVGHDPIASQLTPWRSAAPNRLTISAEAGALAARLYHRPTGLGCLASAAVPC